MITDNERFEATFSIYSLLLNLNLAGAKFVAWVYFCLCFTNILEIIGLGNYKKIVVFYQIDTVSKRNRFIVSKRLALPFLKMFWYA